MIRRNLALALGVALALLLAPQSASAAPKPPTLGLHFSRPLTAGGPGASYNDAFVNLIRSQGHPEVHTVVYDSTEPATVDVLLANDRAGGATDVLTWNAPGARSAAMQRLHNWTPRTKGSHYKECRGSCRRDGSTGNPHAKITTVSPDYVLVGSGNLRGTTDDKAWNDYLLVRSPACYRAAVGYIVGSRADKTMRQWPTASCGGGVSLIFYPLQRESDDPVRRDLAKIKCRKGDRIVQDMYTMKWEERKVVDAETKLAKSGCSVLVIATRDKWAEKTIARLKAGGVEVRNAGAPGRWTHLKRFTIRAHDAHGKAFNRVYTGSALETKASLTRNMEVQVRLDGKAWVAKVEAQENLIARYSARI